MPLSQPGKKSRLHLVLPWMVVVTLGASSPALADSINVSVDTSSLAGIAGDLAFDFIGGGSSINTVTITGFSSDGTLGSATLSGSASGALPGTVTLTTADFFNEYLTGFEFGSTLSFVLNQTENPPAPGGTPDEFSFYFLDSMGANSLATTSDPTGADALFGSGSDGSLDVFTSPQVTTTASPSPTAPEPASILLLSGALAVLGVMGRLKSRRRLKAAPLAIAAITAIVASSSTVSAQTLPPYNFAKIVDSATPRPDGQGNFFPFTPATVSIDGNWAAFISFTPTQSGLEIWSYNLSTQQFAKLVDFSTPVPGSPGGGHFSDFEACGPAFWGYAVPLHDGVVVFQGADSSATGCGGGVYSVPVGGGAVSRVVDYTMTLPGSGGNFKGARANYGMSVSQGWVVFYAETSNGDAGVWAAQVNGNGLERIAESNTVYSCPPNTCDADQYLFPFIQAGNVVFTGSGLFGAEGWQGLFVTPVTSPTLSPVLNSTQILPGDTGPNNPGKIADFLLPVIDGGNIYFTAGDVNSSCVGGGNFSGVFQVPLSGGSTIKIADTCDTLPGFGTLNTNNSFVSLAAGGGTLAFQVMSSADETGIYASANGVLGPVIAVGDTLLGNTVFGLNPNGNLGNNAVSQGRIAFFADFGSPDNNFGFYLASPPCAVDISSQVTVTRGGFLLNHATGQFSQVVSLKNSTGAAISGPIALLLENLSSDAALANASGSSTCASPGSPYIVVPLGAGNSLAAGASMNVTLQFTDPSRGAITYSAAVVAGTP